MIKENPSCLLLCDFGLNKETFLTRAGFEPKTSGLTSQRPTNLAISPYVGGLPILSMSLFGMSVKKRTTINCRVARDHNQVYDLEAGARSHLSD